MSYDRMIEVKTHTLTIPTMSNASTTAAFRHGKALLDAVNTSSAERPPPLITCRRSFAVGFNPVFILLLLLVSIVAFAFMMMVVDNRNGWSVNCHATEVCCGHVTTQLSVVAFAVGECLVAPCTVSS